MENNLCAAALMESTASKIQLLQKAFADLESHRAVTLNFKWKQLEEHLFGLQKSLKRRFTELEEREKEFDAKLVESTETLEKRKAAVRANEQASLKRLQEKRDASVTAILTCMQKKRPFPGDSVFRDTKNHVEEPFINETLPCSEGNIDLLKKRAKNFDVQVRSYPELVKLCREMNSEGLQKFISDNRRDLPTLREEIPVALSASVDPGALVLETLKSFYGTDVPNFDPKKDSNLLGLRRTCILLMECLSRLLIDQDVNYSYYEISENVQQRAKNIAEKWKPKLEDLDADASSGNSLEAHAFLLLLSTFSISSQFDQKSLFKLIPMVSRRRQIAELCRSLGLIEKMPGMMDSLINNGRQIDAVNLAFAFELTDRFSPIPLLKSYLSEAKKAPYAPKVGNTTPAASSQSNVNDKELLALKAVIKCIEDHKLEEQFPLEPLQKQVLEIEKAKTEKKRATEVAKPQSKRARATTIIHAPRVSSSVAADKNYHGRMSDRYQQYGYEMPPYAAYPEPHIPPYMGYTMSLSHGNFFGNAYQYQTGYLH